MQLQASRDTQIELAIRSELHRRGLRFRVHMRPIESLRREADIVFTGRRVAVFVDGCFWHGCPLHGTKPKSNAAFWEEKIETNRRRDEDTDRQLIAAGWVPLRCWEHEAVADAVRRIEDAVRQR